MDTNEEKMQFRLETNDAQDAAAAVVGEPPVRIAVIGLGAAGMAQVRQLAQQAWVKRTLADIAFMDIEEMPVRDGLLHPEPYMAILVASRHDAHDVMWRDALLPLPRHVDDALRAVPIVIAMPVAPAGEEDGPSDGHLLAWRRHVDIVCPVPSHAIDALSDRVSAFVEGIALTGYICFDYNDIKTLFFHLKQTPSFRCSIDSHSAHLPEAIRNAVEQSGLGPALQGARSLMISYCAGGSLRGKVTRAVGEHLRALAAPDCNIVIALHFDDALPPHSLRFDVFCGDVTDSDRMPGWPDLLQRYRREG